MNSFNIWAILVSAIAVFLLGGVWYSPRLFGETWQIAEGRKVSNCNKGSHSPRVFALFFIMAILSAYAFDWLLRPDNWLNGLKLGLIVGLFFVAVSFSINYMFAGRNIKLLLVDAGYHISQFVLYGLIIGAWH